MVPSGSTINKVTPAIELDRPCERVNLRQPTTSWSSSFPIFPR